MVQLVLSYDMLHCTTFNPRPPPAQQFVLHIHIPSSTSFFHCTDRHKTHPKLTMRFPQHPLTRSSSLTDVFFRKYPHSFLVNSFATINCHAVAASCDVTSLRSRHSQQHNHSRFASSFNPSICRFDNFRDDRIIPKSLLDKSVRHISYPIGAFSHNGSHKVTGIDNTTMAGIMKRFTSSSEDIETNEVCLFLLQFPDRFAQLDFSLCLLLSLGYTFSIFAQFEIM